MSSPSQKPFRGMQINRVHPLAKGLVGTWVMNEKTGDKVFDLSGNGNHGTIHGADWVAGGLDFNGTSDYVESNTQVNEAAGTIFIQTSNDFNDTSSSPWYMLIDTEPSTSRLIFAHANNYNWQLFTDTTLRCQYDSPIDIVGSHLWTITYSESGSAIYLDGVEVASASGDHSNGEQGTKLYFGSRYTQSDFYDGIISNTLIYNRAFSAKEIEWLHREPYAMFQQPISPAGLFVSLIDFATNLLHGKIIIKDTSTDNVDGKIVLKDVVTNLFDGKVILSNIATNLADGKVVIKDSISNLVDGLIKIKNNTINLLDGKVILSNISTVLVDGKLRIKNITTNLFDGLLKIKDSVINLADGKVIVTTSGLYAGIADGKIQIKGVTTRIVDCLLKVKDNVIELTNGKVNISNIDSNFTDGKIVIKDSISSLLDSKLIIKNISTILIDSKVQIKDSTIGLIDGLIKVKDDIISNVDSKIKIKNVITSLIDAKIKIGNFITNLLDGKITIENVQVYKDINLTSTFNNTISLTSEFNKTIDVTSTFNKTINATSGFDFA